MRTRRSSHAVLVLSDTHLNRGADLPDAVLELADAADHVVHAGDIASIDVLDTLEAISPVTAVWGNVDGFDLVARLRERAEVVVAGVAFGVVHDAGTRAGRHARLHAMFPEAQVLVYGHTHEPELVRSEHGVLVLNPGSATQKRLAPSCSVAWLELRQGVIDDAQLVHLD